MSQLLKTTEIRLTTDDLTPAQYREDLAMCSPNIIIDIKEETPYTTIIDKLIKMERELICLNNKHESLRIERCEYLELHKLFKDDIDGFRHELMLILENNSSLCAFHKKEEDHPVKDIKIEKILYSLGDENFKAGVNYIYTITISIKWPHAMVNGPQQVINSLRNSFTNIVDQYFKSVNEITFILKDAK